MAACTSTSYDEQESAKRASLLRCPNKQYTAPFWLKVKQLFMSKDIKKNVKCEEQKKIRRTQEKSDKTYSNRPISRRKIFSIILLVALFCFSSVGFVIMWFTDIYLKQILETITVQNGSFMFESWRKPSLKPLICVYAFNYTNLDEFLIFKADKLKVVETGPYCYRETLEKINVHFNDEEGTVTYGNKRTHKFDPIHSKGNPNDTLVLPNPALITAVTKVSEFEAFSIAKMVVSSALRVTNSKVILRVRAHDFFFGYDDPFLEMVTGLGRFLQMDIPFKKFGILAIRAAETDSTLTVKTGKDDLDNIDVVTAVNGEPNITIWFGDECNRIDGSDGAFFPRKEIKKSNTLYLFHQDICRKLPLVYDKEVDFQDGIMAMRFHMPPWVYDTNGTCFCEDNCPPKGLFDLTLCSHGIPFLMSFPHFLHGDPRLTEDINGLHPNSSLHDFYIDIQPNLGFTLGMVSRLQVNMQVVKTPGMPFLNAFKNNVVLPIVWIEVFADHMPPDLFRVIYHATFTVRSAQLCLMWGTLIAMIVTALSILYSLWRIPGREKLRQNKEEELRKRKDQTEQAASVANPKEITISDSKL